MQIELLRELNHTQEFLEARHQLEKIQDDWHRSCESKPMEVPGYILETDAQIFQPGISTCGASLLICLDEPDTTANAKLLETVASRILEQIKSESADYEDVYLRGLLTYQENYPWREVPMSLTDGREVWVVDINLDRVFLPGGHLEGRSVRCWTAPTKEGRFAWLCDDALDSSSFDESQQAAVYC